MLSEVIKEMWKDIKGYEGYYQVSDTGRVRSVDRYVTEKVSEKKHFLKGKEMRLTEAASRSNSEGYLVVNLRKDGSSTVCLVHRLVAEAFIPNDNCLPTINHIDGNKHNNTVENLEWCSYSYNNTHALENNLRRPRGNRVLQCELNGTVVNSFRSICEAARRTGLGRSSISHCVNGRQRTYAGFVWRYENNLESQTTISKESTPEDELPAEAQRPR